MGQTRARRSRSSAESGTVCPAQERESQPDGNSAWIDRVRSEAPPGEESMFACSLPSTREPGQPGWAAALEEGQGSSAQSIRCAPAEVKRLLDLVRSPILERIASFDKISGDISGYDWTTGNGLLPDLLPLMRQLAPSEIVFQDTIWFLYEMTSLEPDPSMQRVYDLDSGVIRTMPIPQGMDFDRIRAGVAHAQAKLTANNTLRDNQGDAIERTGREDFSSTIADAQAARARLSSVFHFDPSDRSLKAVRDMRGGLRPDELQPVLDDYLTAFFVSGASPHEGLKYAVRDIGALFDDPPSCDQLPDGRGIIDCKGFSALSQLLFRELSGGQINADPTEITYQFAVRGHQMALIRTGSEVMAIDNDAVVPLSMSGAELGELEELHASAEGGSLRGPIDLEALPTLGRFVADIYDKYNIPGTPEAFWYEVLHVSPS
jgi:hypothetical protein